MKKIASILVLVLVFVFTLTTQAQKKRRDNRPQLSVKQQTSLAVKQMTLALDLSEKQQGQIVPLIQVQAAAKKEAMYKRKAMQESNTKPSSDEIYEMKSKMLDNQIAFKNNLKDILNKEQFEQFQKMKKARKMRGNKEMREMKKGKIAKEEKKW
jgi:protein CpxP